MSEGEAVGLIRQVFICRQNFHSEKYCHHYYLLWLIITAQVKFRRGSFQLLTLVIRIIENTEKLFL